MEKLLTRTAFRDAVFAAGRHNYYRLLKLNGLASEAPDRPDEGA